MLGYDSSANNLRIYKLKFTNTSPDWALTKTWPASPWTAYYSESLLISSSIYSLFSYGNAFKYLYFAVISVADGTVSVRYKSSANCNYIWGSGTSGDYIIASVWTNNFLIFNKATNTFILKVFTSNLYGIGYETATGR